MRQTQINPKNILKPTIPKKSKKVAPKSHAQPLKKYKHTRFNKIRRAWHNYQQSRKIAKKATQKIYDLAAQHQEVQKELVKEAQQTLSEAEKARAEADKATDMTHAFGEVYHKEALNYIEQKVKDLPLPPTPGTQAATQVEKLSQAKLQITRQDGFPNLAPNQIHDPPTKEKKAGNEILRVES